MASHFASIDMRDGKSFAETAAAMNLSIFTPTSGTLPNPAANNEPMHIWFTRQPDWDVHGCRGAEDLKHADESIDAIAALVANLEASFDYIVLGGFSQGGCLSLHALRKDWSPKVKGIFSMGSFLVAASQVVTGPLGSGAQLPVVMMHGANDDLVSAEFGRETAERLETRGIAVSFRSYEGLLHDISADELNDLLDWVRDLIK
ncbi:Aste57867_4705 [Aphanomyces stellatus]|uniref:Aste57867_4705 protein n=1 Tax=Aphanomyces stellatus TaxID=120398 RepID=A0A485KGZ8_9STRA|nr:hypothetical protein As57867_004692 [Aphanomyces stellatus]VFT81805.1 Aste57867_4705 [Aphanomyces stellatus]